MDGHSHSKQINIRRCLAKISVINVTDWQVRLRGWADSYSKWHDLFCESNIFTVKVIGVSVLLSVSALLSLLLFMQLKTKSITNLCCRSNYVISISYSIPAKTRTCVNGLEWCPALTALPSHCISIAAQVDLWVWHTVSVEVRVEGSCTWQWTVTPDRMCLTISCLLTSHMGKRDCSQDTEWHFRSSKVRWKEKHSYQLIVFLNITHH